MRTFSIILAALLLSACATCEQHPVACSVATGVVATSIALSLRKHDDSMAPRRVQPDMGVCSFEHPC